MEQPHDHVVVMGLQHFVRQMPAEAGNPLWLAELLNRAAVRYSNGTRDLLQLLHLQTTHALQHNPAQLPDYWRSFSA